MPTPKQTELSVNYSVGVKANLGDYENANVMLSRSERWDTSGMTPEEIDAFYLDRYEKLREELGKAVEFEYQELKS